MQNNQNLTIEVWIIQESLAPQMITTVNTTSDLTLISLKALACGQLRIDPDRYELLLLQTIESSYILRNLQNLTLKIEQTQILATMRVCLKFEDINWDFSKSQDSNFSSSATIGNFGFIEERIRILMQKPKKRLRFRRMSVIRKELMALLAEVKMGF